MTTPASLSLLSLLGFGLPILVAEVSDPCEDHRYVVLSCGRNHFLVAHGSAGLDDGRDPGVGRGVDAVTKREERIGGQHRSAGPVASALDRDLHRPDAVRLTAADPHRGAASTSTL